MKGHGRIGTVVAHVGRRVPFPLARRVFVVWLEQLRETDPAEGLPLLLQLDSDVQVALDRAAIAYDGGIHAKHRLMRYHDFFVERVHKDEQVLDVGSGKGELAFDLAVRSGAHVTGIDFYRTHLDFARSRFSHPRLRFLEADAVTWEPDQQFDVVVLSNVLEHIAERTVLLRSLAASTRADRFLIRVPAYDRHWTVPLREELGLPYFSDATHEIEYTTETFLDEMATADLRVEHLQVNWGELWAEARVAREH
jgi:SAM-dependent methyltransferase